MSLTRINKTGEPQVAPTSDGRVIISVPIQNKRRSGRKIVTLPGGEGVATRLWDRELTSLQLALARGHPWLVVRHSVIRMHR